MSGSATSTIRLDASIKEEAKLRAGRLGVSLRTVVENDLRRFIDGHPIIDDDSYVPSAMLREDIEAANAEYAAGECDTIPSGGIDAYFANLIEANR